MVTATELSENSRQGFGAQKPTCIGLETGLSRNSRWGCGHIYDETPVDIAVYVRNDPVNKFDPNGQKWWSIFSAIGDIAAGIGTTVWGGMEYIGSGFSAIGSGLSSMWGGFSNWYFYNNGSTSEEYEAAQRALVMIQVSYALDAFAGFGPKQIEYGPNDPFTLEFQKSHDMAPITASLLADCSKQSGNASADTFAAAFYTYLDAAYGNFNLAEAQLGAFSASWARNDDGTVTVSLTNDISINSLTLHISGDVLGIPNIEGNLPYGNVTQHMVFSMADPCD